MRKWAYLKEPYHTNKRDIVYKIMIHEQKKHTWYPDLESALEDWENEIDAKGWHMIDDPLPDCQDDCIEPIRVKGRVEGNPEWGKFEILRNGVWEEYIV